MNNHVKSISSSLLVLSFVASLLGCQESSVKRDAPAPPVSEKLAPSGHIQSKTRINDSISNVASIPNIITTQIPKLPSIRPDSNSKLYSISAVRTPVKELLFKLAKMSNSDIDLDYSMDGDQVVTINAINKPLNTIIERISDQAGLAYSIENGVLRIKSDLPEWRNYKVDYVNIIKTSKDTIDMKLDVSSSGSDVNGGSSTSVSVESVHDFWKNLKENIEILAQPNPLESVREEDTISTRISNRERAGRLSRAGANAHLIEGGQNDVKANSESKSQASSFIKQSRSVNTLVNPEAGMISVYTTSNKHKSIKKYIDDVVSRVDRQVLIEATVVEVALNDKYQTGINWSLFGNNAFGNDGGIQISSPFNTLTDGFSINTVDNAGTPAGVGSGDWNILSKINLLKTFGDSRVLSSPKIMAINNQTALLKVVKNQVYFTVDVNTTPAVSGVPATTTYETEIKTVPIGFTMSVTPFVSDKGTVTLNVRPTISTIESWVNDPNPELQSVPNPIPVVQEKEMSSVLQLRDKQTAIIGGLIEDYNNNMKSGLPWVSDVPVFGDLFSARSDETRKKELVVFIRPIIIRNPDIDNGDLHSVSRFLKTDKY